MPEALPAAQAISRLIATFGQLLHNTRVRASEVAPALEQA